MGDLNQDQSTQSVRLVGGDEAHAVDVVLDGGVKKLAAKADVTVNSLRGFDQQADGWIFVGTEADTKGAGGIGDTVRIQIAAGDNPTNYPAVDVTSTLTATEAGDETALANLIVNDLNANANFSLNFFARRIFTNATTVYISAKQPGPEGARPNVNDLQVSTTGTTVMTRAFDNIAQRQKDTILSRDPSNPTLGVLSASGSLQVSEGDVTGRIIEFAMNGTYGDNLLQNGSGTPIDFLINASATKERFFTSLRFEALGNGIQFTNFLSKNSALSTGILVTIRSNDSEIDFPLIKATEDFASFFSRGPSDFDFFDVAGTDYFRATLSFTAPFQLYKQGTFSTDDFIRVRVQDDLSSGMAQFKFIGFGFERDF